nr:MAG TPA: hypothetical protein [Caudoviricetes sp.]
MVHYIHLLSLSIIILLPFSVSCKQEIAFSVYLSVKTTIILVVFRS